MSLTRADFESKRLQKLLAQSNLDFQVLTDEELQSSIDQTLRRQAEADVWLFAYGSLIWNPTFNFVERRVAKIYGLHRRFCLSTPLGRGTPDNPGLLLGLDRGGSCRGIVYRIAASEVQTELLLIWRREMVVGSYIPTWVKVFDQEKAVSAIAFVINRHHRSYAGQISLEATIERLATARGAIGSSADYLFNTVEGLLAAGIHDHHLLCLRDRVLTHQHQLLLKSQETV
jgi:cation transport protein ChaC